MSEHRIHSMWPDYLLYNCTHPACRARAARALGQSWADETIKKLREALGDKP